jgi:hypothetical protein
LSPAERLLEVHLTEKGILFEREVCLVPGRKWRWDFVIENLAIEIQGGIWRKKGAHNTGLAITRDCQKMRGAVENGYTPVHFVTSEVLDGTAIAFLSQYIGNKDVLPVIQN